LRFSYTRLATTAVLAAALLVVPLTAASASEPDVAPPNLPTLPETMTPAEMDAISSDGVVEIEFPTDATAQSNGGVQDLLAPGDGVLRPGDGIVSPQSVRTGIGGGDSCQLDPGIMWSRTSGSGYQYGTIGSKPRLHSCTIGVRQTGMASEVWQFNGWFWFKAAGTFNSYGTGNMTQLSVQHICTGRGNYPYKVITTAYGTNSQGATGVGRDSTAEFKFNCG